LRTLTEKLNDLDKVRAVIHPMGKTCFKELKNWNANEVKTYLTYFIGLNFEGDKTVVENLKSTTSEFANLGLRESSKILRDLGLDRDLRLEDPMGVKTKFVVMEDLPEWVIKQQDNIVYHHDIWRRIHEYFIEDSKNGSNMGLRIDDLPESDERHVAFGVPFWEQHLVDNSWLGAYSYFHQQMRQRQKRQRLGAHGESLLQLQSRWEDPILNNRKSPLIPDDRFLLERLKIGTGLMQASQMPSRNRQKRAPRRFSNKMSSSSRLGPLMDLDGARAKGDDFYSDEDWRESGRQSAPSTRRRILNPRGKGGKKQANRGRISASWDYNRDGGGGGKEYTQMNNKPSYQRFQQNGRRKVRYNADVHVNKNGRQRDDSSKGQREIPEKTDALTEWLRSRQSGNDAPTRTGSSQ